MTAETQTRRKTREEIARAYASEPWWYDLRGFAILTFAYRSTLWEQVRFFGENMRANHLEVAIGTGTLFDLVLKWRKWKRMGDVRVTGVDYADRMLAGAERRFAGKVEIDLRKADVAALPFANEFFDSVNIANAVHCFPDIDASFAEIFRVTKRGGSVAANVLLYPKGKGFGSRLADRINRWGMKKGILVTPYEAADIRKRLTASGFAIDSESIIGNTYEVRARRP